MRSWLLAMAALLFVSLYTAPGYAAGPSECDLVMKIQKYVSQAELVAMFGPSESARKKSLAKLKKQYAKTLAKLRDGAAKNQGVLKELQDAVAQFEANLAPCAKCQHDYRNLIIDVAGYEDCKAKFCDPADGARRKILDQAWKCKKGK